MLLIISAVCTLLPRSFSAWLRGTLQPVLAPLGDAGTYLTTMFEHRVDKITAGSTDPKRSENLTDDSDYYRGMAVFWKRQAENYRHQIENLLAFQNLYGPLRDLPAVLIPARVVGQDFLPYGRVRTLNVGKENGVNGGTLVLLHDRSKVIQGSHLAVVTATALVGEVVETAAFTARFRLISDRSFSMPARIRRVVDMRTVTVTSEGQAAQIPLTQDQPIDVVVQGDGGKGLIVDNVKAYDNVKPGDLLVTNDEFLRLPVEIRIGVVSGVEPDPSSPQRVRLLCRPDADLNRLRDVLIVAPVHAGQSRSRR